jgi:predicted nucleic acid-binding protein
MTIWIDSSFLIGYLKGDLEKRHLKPQWDQTAILPSQYAETLVFFAKITSDLTTVVQELDTIALDKLTRLELKFAASLYVHARSQAKNKTSLADAMLAAVVHKRKGKLLSFDHDFRALGFKNNKGLWQPVVHPK